MPRSVADILAHADSYAQRFETWEPDPANIKDAKPLAQLRRAFEHATQAQCAVVDAVAEARREGFSWALIGTMVGTTGEAARQRYGPHADA